MVEVKRCKKCGKLLHSKNKSGLCSYHYTISYIKEKNKRKRELLKQIAIARLKEVPNNLKLSFG